MPVKKSNRQGSLRPLRVCACSSSAAVLLNAEVAQIEGESIRGVSLRQHGCEGDLLRRMRPRLLVTYCRSNITSQSLTTHFLSHRELLSATSRDHLEDILGLLICGEVQFPASGVGVTSVCLSLLFGITGAVVCRDPCLRYGSVLLQP